jgi:hypothetical protein
MKRNKTSMKFLDTAFVSIMLISIAVAFASSMTQIQKKDSVLSTKTVKVKVGTQDVNKTIKRVEVKPGNRKVATNQKVSTRGISPL